MKCCFQLQANEFPEKLFRPPGQIGIREAIIYYNHMFILWVNHDASCTVGSNRYEMACYSLCSRQNKQINGLIIIVPPIPMQKLIALT